MQAGALHHTKFMVKAIYFLKTDLFRNRFQMTTKENNAIKGYFNFCCAVANAAKVFLQNLLSHLWYLHDHLIAFRYPKSDGEDGEDLFC